MTTPTPPPGAVLDAESADGWMQSGGWTAHDGGPNPVGNTVVEVLYRNEETDTRAASRFDWNYWGHSRSDLGQWDIIAYRLARPTPEPCFECGSPERIGEACKPCNPELTRPTPEGEPEYASGCGYTGREFGAAYNDSICIDGDLWDLDSDDDGELTKGGDIPCPKCNADAEVATPVAHEKRAKALSELAALDGETMDFPDARAEYDQAKRDFNRMRDDGSLPPAQPEPGAGELAREPVTHEVKCWRAPFAAVKSGAKPWELRKNDRDYRVGDTLRQLEWDEDACQHTGDQVEHLISWALYGPAFGLPDGYVIMTLTLPDLTQAQAKIARLEREMAERDATIAMMSGQLRAARERGDNAEADAAKVREAGWQLANDVPVWSDGIVTDGENVALAQKAEADYGGIYWSVETGDGAILWEPTHFIALTQTERGA